MQKAIKCPCGKLICYREGAKIFIKCRKCKRIIDILDVTPLLDGAGKVESLQAKAIRE